MFILAVPYVGKSKIPGAELGPSSILKEMSFYKEDTYEICFFNQFQDNNKVLHLREQLTEHIASKEIILVLGGDHSTTTYVLNTLFNTNENWGCVIFDAHNDYSAAHFEELCNWNVINGIYDRVANGVVIGFREEHYLMPECKKFKYIKDFIFDFDKQVVENVNLICRNYKYIYLSLDVDVINPCEFPGTGYKSAGGIMIRDLIRYIRLIKEKAEYLVVDIVEFNPLIEKEQSLLGLRRVIKDLGC